MSKEKTPISVPTREKTDRPLSAQLHRRFYKTVAVVDEEQGFCLHLDGRPVRTPGRQSLAVPVRPLADAMAEEWRAQKEMIEPLTMPLTQLANTAIDRVRMVRPALLEELRRYGNSDLLCYRADHPADLVERQDIAWQPVLDWLSMHHGAILNVTSGLMPMDQDAASLDALTGALEGLDDWSLVVVQSVTAVCGSLALALALEAGRLTGDEVFALSQLDETYQREQWGDDAEAAARRDTLRAEVLVAERFLRLVREEGVHTPS